MIQQCPGNNVMLPVKMLLIRVFIGFMAVLRIAAGSCRPGEYETAEGKCCPTCLEGNRVKTDCAEDRSTYCQPCAERTFMDVPNGEKQCRACARCDEGSGLRTKTSCTTVSDTVCEPQQGSFCIDTLDKSCIKAQQHRRCQAGYYVKEKGNSRNDTVCEVCAEGSFSEDGVACKAWTVCSETKETLVKGSRERDVVCGNATRHHYVVLLPLLSLLILFVTGTFILKPNVNGVARVPH